MLPRTRVLLLLASLTALLGCRASAPPTPEQIEARLRSGARTFVDEPAFTLGSPYDEAGTAAWARVAGEECERVRQLFDDRDPTPLRIYLVPRPETASSEGGDALLDQLHPHVDGTAAGAWKEGFLALYVAAPERPGALAPALAAEMLRPTLRHELCHLVARRAGLVRAAWYHEGLALEVESMHARGSTLERDPFPAALAEAQMQARPGDLERLLGWRLDEAQPRAERARRYLLAHALVRWLFEREAAAAEPFRALAARVQALPDEELRADEAAWLAWLAAQDVLACIERTPPDRELASLLPRLAERRVPALATRRADELALRLLGEPCCAEPALTFLVYFRARALSPADLEALESAADPLRAFTALALRQRRGEALDLEAARARWAGLSQAERDRLRVPAVLLGLDRAP